MRLLLAVYGTFRKGHALAHYLDHLRKYSECKEIELTGLQIFVLGEAPGAKITNNPKDKAVVELIEMRDVTEKAISGIILVLDSVEGVESGLYQREFIDTPKGKALIYTYAGQIHKGAVKITDWAEWMNKPESERSRLLLDWQIGLKG